VASANSKSYTHPFNISVWYLKIMIAILLLLKFFRHDYDFCYNLVDYSNALPALSRMPFILKDSRVLTYFTNAHISHTSRMKLSLQWRGLILLSSIL